MDNNNLYKLVGHYNGAIIVYTSPIEASFLTTGDIVDRGADGIAHVIMDDYGRPNYVYINDEWQLAFRAKAAKLQAQSALYEALGKLEVAR